MTTITGTIRDSGNQLLSGKLVVTLDAQMVDPDTDDILTVEPRTFAIASGAVSLDLPQTATEQVTQRFQFFVEETITTYYFQDGTIYAGPTHYHTDNQWYTGAAHTVDSVLLNKQDDTIDRTVLDFRAIIPNQASVDFSELLPTGITTEVLDTSIRRLAELLTSNSNYAAALRGGPNWKGAYSASTTYQYNDGVSSGASSYVFISQTPQAGNAPPSSAWQVI
jgi:hypothetical protein